MPISLEQWRAAVNRWVARIQRILIIRRGVKRPPSCDSSQEGAPSPSGQPHSGEKKCMMKKKGRKKRKDKPAITTDDFYDGMIALAAIVAYLGKTEYKHSFDTTPVGPLKELLGYPGVGALLVVIMILLLRSGDVEVNPGPVERGTHILLNISSKPTLPQLDKLIVSSVAGDWEQTATHLGVEPFLIDTVKADNPGHCEEACRGVLNRWLNAEPGSGTMERTWPSVLKVLEESGYRQVALQLRREHFEESSEGRASELTSPPVEGGGGRQVESFWLRKLYTSMKIDALVDFILWHTTLVAFNIFLLLCLILHEYGLAHLTMIETWRKFKETASLSGNRGLSFPCRKTRVFLCIFVHCPLTVCMAVVRRYEHQTVSKQLCSVLAKLPPLRLLQGVKCARKIRGHLVVAFTVEMSFVMCIRSQPSTFCLAFQRCAACVAKWLSQAVFNAYIFLRCLLLLAGDVETNPGPIPAEDVLTHFRDKFIADLDANTVIMKLLDMGVINDSIKNRILGEYATRLQNEILHNCLKTRCTDDTLKVVCDVIRVAGNPKMTALGEAMLRELEADAQPELQPADLDGKVKAWFSTNPLAQKYLDCVRDTYSEMAITGEYPYLDYIKLRVIESQPSQHKNEDTVQFLRNFQKATVDFISQQDGGRPHFTQNVLSASGLLLHDHFLQQQEMPLHIVFGPPGVGKTSFSRNICSQFNSTPQSFSFSLILLFFVREKRVAEAKSLSDLLSCYGLLHDDLDYKELARQIVKNKGRGIQIIFDGLDERQDLLKDESSIIIRLLKGELEQAQIVVTSRPGVVAQLSDLWHRASLYEVQGFSPQEVKQYVESFFLKEGDPSAAPKLLSALADRPDLTGSTYSPLNLWLICSVFSFKNCTLPDTLTQHYTALLFQLLQRQAKKEGLETAIADTLDKLPASMLAALDSLSQLSYLCCLKEELVFDEEVVIRTCLASRADLKTTFDGMGLLHVHPKKHGVKDHLTFNFLHSTYQEYLCARHITAMTEEEQTAFWKENINNPRFAMVFRFYCGLSQLQVKGVQQIVQGQKLPSKCDAKDRHLLFLFYALHESDNSHLTAVITDQLDSALTFQLLLSPYDFYVIQFCLSKTAHLRRMKFSGVYSHICQPSEFVVPCVSAVASTNTLTSLKLGLSSFTLSDAQHLTAALVAVKDLNLRLMQSSSEAAEELLFIPTLRQLKLHVTSFNDLQTSLHPKSMSCVNKLYLILPSEGDTFLARWIPHCPLVEELVVECNSKVAGDIIASHLPKLKNLRKVEVMNMNPVPILLSVGSCGKLDQAGIIEPQHWSDEDVSNPDTLQSLEAAIREHGSLMRISFECSQSKWTNVATAILKGAARNRVLRQLELVTPEGFLPPQVVDEVRRVNPKLQLFVGARYISVTAKEDSSVGTKEDHVSQPEFKEAVEKAKSNFVEIEVFKVIFLGPPEAGKTQLARALVGDYREVTESTPISTGAKVVVQRFVEKEDSTWEPLSKDVFQQSLHTTASQLMKDDGSLSSQHSSDEAKDSKNKPGQGKVHSEAPTQGSGLVSEASDAHPPVNRGNSVHKHDDNVSDLHTESASELSREQIFHGLLKDVENSCKAYDKDKTLKVCYIHMIDNGGQPAFFDAHPVIATSRATYVLVYNMEEGLDGKPKYTYRKKGKEYAPIQNENDTNLDIINASLMTVISLKEKFIAAEKHLSCSRNDEETTPLFLVVGTRFRPPMSEIQQEEDLCKECSFLYPAWEDTLEFPPFCAKRTKLVPVDSRNEECEGVKTVRKRVIPQGCGLRMNIPIKWFHCHLLFWHAKEEKTESGGKKYPGLEVLQFSTLYELCQQENLISDEKELLNMVHAFHVLGLFVCPALDQKQEEDWRTLNDQPVFTNPDLLYEELTKILEVAFKSQLHDDECPPRDSKLFEWLKEEGELTVEHMTRLGIPDTAGYMSKPDFRSYLLEQLSRWGLAAKIPQMDARSKEGATYFIPSVLRPKPAGQQVLQSATQSCMTIFLTISELNPKKWYYVPNGVFTHFVVNLLNMHNKYTRQKNQGEEVYCYRDSVGLIRHADKEMNNGVQCKYFVTVAISKRWKSIAACIIPTRAKKMLPSDCQIVIWEELKVAMEKACKDMYHTDLTVTVATDCPCTKFGSHLAELCADEMMLSCLLGEEEDALSPNKKLMIDMLKAQHEASAKVKRPASSDCTPLAKTGRSQCMGAANSDIDPVLSQAVHICENHAALFRKCVSKKGAGKGKALLECLGLSSPEIKLCYKNNPHDEVQAIQDGLDKWETNGDHCTWQILLDAMTSADFTQQDCKELEEELHQKMQATAKGSKQPSSGEGTPPSITLKSNVPEAQHAAKGKRPASSDCTPLAKMGRSQCRAASASAKGKRPASSEYTSPAKIGRSQCRVEGILNQFRTQFIADIDPDAVVFGLLEKGIIPDGVKENMTKSNSPTLKNQILLEHLNRQCTEEALIVACDIFIGVTGYPRMAALGKSIKEALETPQTNVSPVDAMKLPTSISKWLASFKLDEYAESFQKAGYDTEDFLIGVSEDDLSKLGVSKRAHRSRLLNDLQKNPPEDRQPKIKPADVPAWLREIGLSQYESALMDEGHDALEFLEGITEKELSDVGMTKQGHVRKFLRSLDLLTKLPEGGEH